MDIPATFLILRIMKEQLKINYNQGGIKSV